MADYWYWDQERTIIPSWCEKWRMTCGWDGWTTRESQNELWSSGMLLPPRNTSGLWPWGQISTVGLGSIFLHWLRGRTAYKATCVTYPEQLQGSKKEFNAQLETAFFRKTKNWRNLFQHLLQQNRSLTEEDRPFSDRRTQKKSGSIPILTKLEFMMRRDLLALIFGLREVVKDVYRPIVTNMFPDVQVKAYRRSVLYMNLVSLVDCSVQPELGGATWAEKISQRWQVFLGEQRSTARCCWISRTHSSVEWAVKTCQTSSLIPSCGTCAQYSEEQGTWWWSRRGWRHMLMWRSIRRRGCLVQGHYRSGVLSIRQSEFLKLQFKRAWHD